MPISNSILKLIGIEDILAQACSSLTATQIAKMYGCSASSVIRIINRHCHPKYRGPVLPKHRCFEPEG